MVNSPIKPSSTSARDNEATQRRAMPKCIFPNAGNTIRNNNAIQKRTVHKSHIPYAGNTIRDNKTTQRSATFKCIITYYPYPLFNRISTIKILWSF